jgi:SAM-dependent methyltransferase
MGAGRYVIRGGVEGRERLRLLSEVMGPSTRALLAEVGIAAGSACLDLGCGGGDVTFELARAVGPSGRVIGVDLDEVTVGMARREAEEERLSNVAFEVRDVVEWEPDERCDVVYARFLLSHLSNPGALIGAVHRYTRPDGVVIVEDIDFRGHFAEPQCRALQRFVELYTGSVKARGADPNIGPRLPGLLRTAGFGNVQMRLVHPAALTGGIKLLTCVTLEDIAEAVEQDGLISDGELRETIEELDAFARDPYTVLGGPRVFQAWGRR